MRQAPFYSDNPRNDVGDKNISGRMVGQGSLLGSIGSSRKKCGEFCRAVKSVSCMASVNGLAKLQYIVASQLLLVGQTWSKQSRIDMTFHDLVKHVTIWRVRSLDTAGRQEENY